MRVIEVNQFGSSCDSGNEEWGEMWKRAEVLKSFIRSDPREGDNNRAESRHRDCRSAVKIKASKPVLFRLSLFLNLGPISSRFSL